MLLITRKRLQEKLEAMRKKHVIIIMVSLAKIVQETEIGVLEKQKSCQVRSLNEFAIDVAIKMKENIGKDYKLKQIELPKI